MKKIKILSLLLVGVLAFSQTPALEFAAGAGNPTGNGPVTGPVTITFQNNTNNPSGNTMVAYAPTLTASFQLINQQFALSTMSTGVPVNFGYNIATPPSGEAGPIFPLLNYEKGITNNNWFTSSGVPANTGIDITVNRGINIFAQTSPLKAAGLSTSGRHRMADLVVTFNRAVDNPIMHIGAMGGYIGVSPNFLGFSQEYDLVSSNVPVTFSKLSGTNALAVTATQINNGASIIDMTGTDHSGSGSIRINGSGITTFTLRIYMRGDGGAYVSGWSVSNTNLGYGDNVLFGLSIATPCAAGATAPTLTNATVTSQTVDLSTTVTGTPPAGSVLQWHSSSIPSAATLLPSTTVTATSTPTNYWAFYYSSTGLCYSPGAKVIVVSNDCTANATTVDLTALPHAATSPGIEVVWYTTPTRNAGTEVSNPTAAGNGTYWPYFHDTVNNCFSPAGTPVVVGTEACNAACYKTGATTGGATLDGKVGISALSRAGADNPDQWPMLRKGAWLVLEAKTKGFVPNRTAFDASNNPVGIAPANFVEGMMVYDTTNKCLKIYTNNGTAWGWYCMTTQACPD